MYLLDLVSYALRPPVESAYDFLLDTYNSCKKGSHCSCDAKFRECLKKTNSLVSAQIGLTYFNVLGPQCFRRTQPIVRCLRRTRITGQKCEEYELDYTKPKMWQWFDNETF